MTAQSLALILMSATVSAFAQIALKLGMSSPGVQQAVSSLGPGAVLTALTNPAVLGGLALYVVSAMIWLLVLAQVNVSVAYPFLGVSLLLTTVFAVLILGESISAPVVLGTALVIAGIVVLSRA